MRIVFCLLLCCATSLAAETVDLDALARSERRAIDAASWAQRYQQAGVQLPEAPAARQRLQACEPLVAAYLAEPDRRPQLRQLILATGIEAGELESVIRHGFLPSAAAVPRGHTTATIAIPRQDGSNYQMPVALWVPKNEAASYDLIIALHGTGGTGENYLQHWFLGAGGKRQREPPGEGRFIIAAPTSDRGHGWGPSPFSQRQIWRLIACLQQIYPIAAVYAEGTSMGGIGSRTFAMAEPDRFAAICQRSAPPYPLPDPRGYEYRNLLTVPMLSYAGDRDHLIPAEAFASEIAFCTQLDLPATMHLFEGRGHEIFSERNQEVLDFFANQRPSTPLSLSIATTAVEVSRRYHYLQIVEARASGNQRRTQYIIDLRRRNEPMLQKIRGLRHGPQRDALYLEAEKAGLVVARMEMWAKPLRVDARLDPEQGTVFLSEVEQIGRLRLLLHPGLIDFAAPFEVRQGTRRLLRRENLQAEAQVLLDALAETGRRDAVWSAVVEVSVR